MPSLGSRASSAFTISPGSLPFLFFDITAGDGWSSPFGDVRGKGIVSSRDHAGKRKRRMPRRNRLVQAGGVKRRPLDRMTLVAR